MIKFCTKVFSFLILLGFILFLFKRSLPFYWADAILTAKIDYLLNSDQGYNTIFIGSSHVQRHINPTVFDTINNTKSYNMGRGAALFLESHYLMEKLLENEKAADYKNILFHTSGKIYPIHDANLKTTRARYHIDWKRFVLGVKYFYRKNDYHQVYNHTIAYISNVLCIGELVDIINFKTGNVKNPLSNIYMNRQDKHQGHRPYPHLPKKKKNFSMPALPKPLKGKHTPISAADLFLIEELHEMRNNLTSKNINFYNIIPPNHDFHLKAPKLNTLYLGDSDTFLEFWDITYRFNKGHLDSKGADMYTEKLGQKFLHTK